MNFVAFDVETANADLASICQVGVAVFKEGRVADLWPVLVNPEDDFDGLNISIHGITPEMVHGAHRLPTLIDWLRSTLEGRVVVAHSWFDRVSLTQACEKYGLDVPTCRWLDTAAVVRRAWPEQFARSGYGLAPVAAFCGVEFRHHSAEEDARAAGEILLRAIADSGRSLEDWFAEVKKPITAPYPKSIKGNPDGPLAGERIVFTGQLSMPRREASVIAAEAGCDVASSVSKKVTLVVVGQQDLRKLEGHAKSNKHRRAEELIAAGHPIRVVGEDDFRRLLDLHDSE